MNTILRNAWLGGCLIGALGLVTPALAGETTTNTTVNPETGASVTVQHHKGILPGHNRTDVTVTPGGPAADPDAVGVAPPPPPAGATVTHSESTTVEHD